MNPFDKDIETLKRRNIKLEGYTRRENVRIFNVKEEAEENTEKVVRNLLGKKLKIPLKKISTLNNCIVFQKDSKSETTEPCFRRLPDSVITRRRNSFRLSKELNATNIGF